MDGGRYCIKHFKAHTLRIYDHHNSQGTYYFSSSIRQHTTRSCVWENLRQTANSNNDNMHTICAVCHEISHMVSFVPRDKPAKSCTRLTLYELYRRSLFQADFLCVTFVILPQDTKQMYIIIYSSTQVTIEYIFFIFFLHCRNDTRKNEML